MADDPENTPPPEPNPDPEPHPEPQPEPPHDELRSLVAGLTERVGDLENTVATIIQIKPDTTPAKRPWTHRKLS